MSLIGELNYILDLQIKQLESSIFISQGRVRTRAYKEIWDGKCEGQHNSHGAQCEFGYG